MRFNWFAHAAACALVVASVHGSADAKPKRPAASAAAKKKASAAAARKEADRLAAEAAAKAAAVAAEKARLRAQWGVLADIGEGDFETESNAPVTVRKDGDAVELTLWTPLARQMVRFERAASPGTLSVSVPGQWSRKTYEARVLADGSIEATTKNDTRWTALSRDPSGKLQMALVPGGKLSAVSLVPGSKADTKLGTLIASGKVTALGTGRGVPQGLVQSSIASPTGSVGLPAAGGIPSMATLQATEGFDLFRRLEGDWWNGSVKWSIAPVAGAVVIEGSAVGSAPAQRKLELKGGKLLLDRSEAVPLSGGAYFPKRGYAVVRKNDESFVVTAGKMKGGSFLASRDQNLSYLGEYRRMTPQMAATFQQQIRTYEVAQAEAAAARAREKAASGNSGWLGGLIMGGVAAAAGGDAGMVMGAAMKGVEMTTDNEMSRNVLAGQGDAMIQSSIDTKRQIAETERLRVAAAEETRRKREAEAQAATDARNAKSLSDQQARDAQSREATAKAEQQKRDAAVAAEAEKRRKAEEQRLADLKRKQEEAARPIEFKEGVVLCEKKKENYYRCDGPLQVTYSDLQSLSGRASIGQACGSDRWRDMGMAGSYRAFGCNFGMNPDGMAPGNRDVPAAYGLFVERAIFHCPRSKDAYCMTR